MSNATMMKFVSIALAAIVAAGCGDADVSAINSNPVDAGVKYGPKILKFEAQENLWTENSVELVAVFDSDVYYVAFVEGREEEKYEGNQGALVPLKLYVKGLSSGAGFSATMYVWSKKPADIKAVPVDDAAYTSFRTRTAPVVETKLEAKEFTIESFGSGSALARFTGTKQSNYTLEQYVPGQGWQYFEAGGNVTLTNEATEFYFDTVPMKTYRLRVTLGIYNTAESAVSNEIVYTAPAAELSIGNEAYGLDVMYFIWSPAGAESNTEYADLKAYCGEYDVMYYDGQTSSAVYGAEVFVNFSVYYVVNNNSRCYMTGRHIASGHKVRSNQVPMGQLTGPAMQLEVLAVNAVDAQFRFNTGNRTLNMPQVYCNTPENDVYGWGEPYSILWQQSYAVSGVVAVGTLVPERRHFCTAIAVDAHTGQRVIVRPVFIMTRAAYHISFTSFGVTTNQSGYNDARFRWNTRGEATNLHFACTCDHPGNPGCSVTYESVVSGTEGYFTMSGLIGGSYYTCSGYATPRSGPGVFGGGEYFFLDVPMGL